jgi:hypothetical protein
VLGAVAIGYVKPLIVAALVGLIVVHWLSPLDAAVVAVGSLWLLVAIFT